MSSVKRRKVCLSCKEECSTRHLYRHVCQNQRTAVELSDSGSTSSSANYMDETPSSSRQSDAAYPSDINPSNSDDSASDDQEINNEDIVDSGSSRSDDSSDSSEYVLESEELLAEFVSDSESDSENFSAEQKGYITWILKLLHVLTWKIKFYISHLAFSYILILIKCVLYLFSSSNVGKELFENFPSNVYQLEKEVSFDKNALKNM